MGVKGKGGAFSSYNSCWNCRCLRQVSEGLEVSAAEGNGMG